MPGAQSQGRAASMQPLGKNKKGHHPNTPPLWETSRAQHCQAKRYSWAMKNMTVQELLAAYASGERNFSYANLRGADLVEADLSGADLNGANLSFARLSLANLSEANLRGAVLSEANLDYADLRCADLRRADLSYAKLFKTNLDGAIGL